MHRIWSLEAFASSKRNLRWFTHGYGYLHGHGLLQAAEILLEDLIRDTRKLSITQSFFQIGQTQKLHLESFLRPYAYL